VICSGSVFEIDCFYGICFLTITQFVRFDEFSLNESVRKVADVTKNFKNTVAQTTVF
jgi:hypothetical protein